MFFDLLDLYDSGSVVSHSNNNDYYSTDDLIYKTKEKGQESYSMCLMHSTGTLNYGFS